MNPLNHSAPDLPPRSSSRRAANLVRLAALAAVLGAAATGALAQYKIVGPDGRVTYTDKPPGPADVRPGTAGTNGAGGGTGGLPYETRQASAKYPVTLYTAKGCAACDSARQWLRGRGVPFSEYSVDNDASVRQFQQRFGGTTVPVVTIGTQTVTGFSSSEMQSFIDAAGYPAQARLTGYAWPAAVALANPAPVPASAPRAVPAVPVAPPVAPPTRSSGIQF